MLTVNRNYYYHYYQKISKGPGGACVRRRGGGACGMAQWHNGQSKPGFLLTFQATMGLSSTVSDINADFINNWKFSLPRVFHAIAKWFPLDFFKWRLGLEKPRMMRHWGYHVMEKVWWKIKSCFDAAHECDSQTDRQKDTGRRQIPRLRIASRSKKIRTPIRQTHVYVHGTRTSRWKSKSQLERKPNRSCAGISGAWMRM